MMKPKITIFFFIFIFLLPISPSFSQPSGTKSSPGGGMKQWKKEARCWRASELNLSSEQAKGLDLIQQTYLRETQLLRVQLFSKRLELREFLTDSTIKIEDIRPKYLEMVEIQYKMEEKAVEYLIKVRNLLTQEQLRNWCPEQEFPNFPRMMHGPGPMGPMHPKKTPPSEE